MPWTYHAPLKDMAFVLDRVLRAPADWAATAAFAELDLSTASAILEEGDRFAREVLLPTNAPGDRAGCTLDGQGNVHTPPGYPEVYKAFVAGGWPALPCDPAYGGQGLPLLLDAAVREMLIACNQAWEMYPDLLHGAIETLRAHGSDALKTAYLPKLISGEWLAAMSLTEPQAGSDLGLLRTKATLEADGSLRITGSKCFISGGDHDLTDNIVHLVLCRLPDAPEGSRGLSLALVPKILPDGTRNSWRCEGLEHKMGIHGSATCVLGYEGATGWLIGAPNKGLSAMFVMMNSARMHVGLQGLAAQEIATQNALAYAQERLQSRAAMRPANAGSARADAIVHHPAMRHILLGLQARTEGQRVIAYRAAQLIDLAEHHPDTDTRERSARLAALLTPIVKGFCTHHGFHGASAALQVFGGYGFVNDYGIEQCVRDARIAMIYEGTNEIQAIDLVLRKVLADEGATLGVLLDEMAHEAHACQPDAGLADLASGLAAAVAAARAGTQALKQHALSGDPERPLMVADDFLMALGHTLLAWAFCASARAAQGHEDAAWAEAKQARMRYGMQWLVPQGEMHWRRVQATSLALPAL